MSPSFHRYSTRAGRCLAASALPPGRPAVRGSHPRHTPRRAAGAGRRAPAGASRAPPPTHPADPAPSRCLRRCAQHPTEAGPSPNQRQNAGGPRGPDRAAATAASAATPSPPRRTLPYTCCCRTAYMKVCRLTWMRPAIWSMSRWPLEVRRRPLSAFSTRPHSSSCFRMWRTAPPGG